MKRDCPNEEVEGAGYGPEGPPENTRPTYQKRDSNYQNNRQIYRRANLGPPPDKLPKACNEHDSDAVKLMARELLENSKSEKQPGGNEKLVGTFVRTKRWEEEDQVIREKAKKKEFLRAARIEGSKKDECKRMVLIKGINEEVKKNLAPQGEIKKTRGASLFKSTVDIINRDILYSSQLAIQSEDVARVEVIEAEPQKVVTEKDDGKDLETSEPRWELKVEMFDLSTVQKILHRYTYRKDLGIANEIRYKYAEVLTDAEQENDEYVKREVKARNARLVELGQAPDWKFKGKTGVLEITRGLWEDQAREQASQKRARDSNSSPPKEPPGKKDKITGDQNKNDKNGTDSSLLQQEQIDSEELSTQQNNNNGE